MSVRPWTSTTAALLLGVATFGCAEPQPSWTTASPQAREALEASIAAERKNYAREATVHLQRALELDPQFAVAKAMLLAYPLSKEERSRLIAELEAADVSTLQPQERFLVEYRRLYLKNRQEELLRFMDDFLRQHPDEPFALASKAHLAYQMERLGEAEEIYLRLIEIEPNWVLAQNHLGYIAMARGEFATAEKRFKTYQFIAPDHANPYDSMGELLLLTGRYEEARRELEAALALRPDFTPSFEQLIRLSLLEGDMAGAEAMLARFTAQMPTDVWPGKQLVTQRCRIELWRGLLDGDWERAWLASDECTYPDGDLLWLRYQAALASGRREQAEALRADAVVHLAASTDMPRLTSYSNRAQAVVEHLHGLEQAAEGDLSEALDHFVAADHTLSFGTAETGLLKLLNQLMLARAQEAAGQAQAAAASRQAVQRVNPRLAELLYDRIALPRPTGV